MEHENLNNQESAKLGIGAVMRRLYQEISKEYKVPVERIMLVYINILILLNNKLWVNKFLKSFLHRTIIETRM